MNIKALITTALLLGSTTVALAAPRQPIVRDHRTHSVQVRSAEITTLYEKPEFRPIVTTSPAIDPIETGFQTVARFNRAFDFSLQTINFGCEGQYVGSLRIYAADMNSEVARVVVHKMDGTSYDFLWNHVFATATDGQTGHYLLMVPNAQVKSIDLYAMNHSNSPLSVQIK